MQYTSDTRVYQDHEATGPHPLSPSPDFRGGGTSQVPFLVPPPPVFGGGGQGVGAVRPAVSVRATLTWPRACGNINGVGTNERSHPGGGWIAAPVAQWIRASDFGSEGRGFESLRARGSAV